MGSDSPLSDRIDDRRRAAGAAARRIDREQFYADVSTLELRLAIIDDRFERLAARPDADYRAFRGDTVTQFRSIADRAGVLDAAGVLDEHRRRRVAALLTVLRRRISQLDQRHATHRDRRAHRRDGPSTAVRRPVLLPG